MCHIDISDIGGGVVKLDILVLLKRILIGAGVEQGTILGIVLLGVEGVLKIVPVELEAPGLIGCNLVHEITHAVCGEAAVLVHEGGVAGDEGRRIGSGGEVHEFSLADGDARGLGVLDEQILVHKLLPGGVADLLLGLLVLHAGAGDDFVDLGVPFNILEIVGIANCLTVDKPDIVLAGH